MKTRYILLISAAFLLAGALVSCDKDKAGKREESGKLERFDDLVFFRHLVAWEDTLGIVHRNYGEVLYEEDPRHLYIGVDRYEEAEEMFLVWVAPNGDVRKTGGGMQYHMTDGEGKPEGVVTLAPSTEAGHVAEVTASAGLDLGVFDRITFLETSAWPNFNGEESPYQLGDIMPVNIVTLGGYWGVCIREKAPGVSGYALAITKREYNGGVDLDDGIVGLMEYEFLAIGMHNKYWVNHGCPSKDEAVDIARILARDWDFFEACFDEAGEGKLRRGTSYWTEEWNWKGVYQRWAMVLSTPNNDGLDWFDVDFNKPIKPVLLRETF